jgi:hypothetical protein
MNCLWQANGDLVCNRNNVVEKFENYSTYPNEYVENYTNDYEFYTDTDPNVAKLAGLETRLPQVQHAIDKDDFSKDPKRKIRLTVELASLNIRIPLYKNKDCLIGGSYNLYKRCIFMCVKMANKNSIF